jgi:hypothetical protein
LRLSSIGYERLKFFFICNFLDCIRHFLVIQLTIRTYFIPTTTSIYLVQSFDSFDLDSSHDCIKMPVLTRSMMKRGLQPPPGAAGLLTCPTCCTDGNTSITTTSNPSLLLPSSSSVPDLVDPYNLSSSSSELDDSSLMSSDDDFEFSKFQNSKISSLDTVTVGDKSCHSLSSIQNSKMESDCVDHTNSSVRNEGTSSNQDNIMQMLNHISSKMMDTIQDLQQQLAQNDLKFTEEIRKLS